MIKYVILFVFLISFQSFAFENASFFESMFPTDNPQWMVKISTKLKSGGIINGTGYIVQIDDEYFVRSASHVTLGKLPYSMTTGSGEVLDFSINEFITDNDHDDILIKIKYPKSNPLGIYNHELEQFELINDDQFYSKQVFDAKRKKNITYSSKKHFYIVPNWSKGPFGKYVKLSPSFNRGSMSSRKINNDVSFIQSEDGLSFFSALKTYPGESGSPLIGKTFDNVKALIYGHVLSYKRHYDQSTFSGPKQNKVLVSKYLKGRRGAINNIIWKYSNGNFYRETIGTQKITREIEFLSASSGDGSSGNGGDGSSGNGGSSADMVALNNIYQIGLNYQGQHILAFKVMADNDLVPQGTILLANWSNLRMIQSYGLNTNMGDLELITPQTSIAKLIKDKLKLSRKNSSRNNERCMIDRDALDKGKLSLSLYFHKISKIELNISSHDIVSFNPLQTMIEESEYGRIEYTVNLQGLFSINAAELTSTFDHAVSKTKDIDYFSKHPFIKVKRKGRSPVRMLCKFRVDR